MKRGFKSGEVPFPIDDGVAYSCWSPCDAGFFRRLAHDIHPDQATNLTVRPHRSQAKARFSAPCYNPGMVRPDRFGTRQRVESCCIRLAGESPVAVSAGAPRSRSQATSESLASERDVKAFRRPYGLREGSEFAGPT